MNKTQYKRFGRGFSRRVKAILSNGQFWDDQ